MPDDADTYRPRCRNLCCKAMMVYGEDFEMDPEFQAGITEFWCQLTARDIGPDGSMVSLEDCRDPQRECFKEF